MRRKSERNKNNASTTIVPEPVTPAVATPTTRPRRGRPRRKKSPTPSPSPSPSPSPQSSPDREVAVVVKAREREREEPVQEIQVKTQVISQVPTSVSASASVSPQSRTPTPEECDQMWHVKTTQSSTDTGEIQKLKICLSRPPSTPETPRRKSERISTEIKESPEEVESTSKRSRRRSRRNSAKEASNSDLSVSEDAAPSEVDSEPVSERESRSKSASDSAPVPVVAPLKIVQEKCIAVPIPTPVVESVERTVIEDVVKLKVVKEVEGKPAPLETPRPVETVIQVKSPVKEVVTKTVKKVESPVKEVIAKVVTKVISPVKEVVAKTVTKVESPVKEAPVVIPDPPVIKTAKKDDECPSIVLPSKPIPDADEKTISSSRPTEMEKKETEVKVVPPVVSDKPEVPVSKKSEPDDKRISTTVIPVAPANLSDEKKVTTTEVDSTRKVLPKEVSECPKRIDQKSEIDKVKKDNVDEQSKKLKETAPPPTEKTSPLVSDKKSVKNIAFADSTVSNVSESASIPRVSEEEKIEKVKKPEKAQIVPAEKGDADSEVVKKQDLSVHKVTLETETNGISSESEKTPAVSISDSSNQTSRKRRWGSRSSKVTKSPAINISTDSLKNLIPMVDPVSVEDILPETNEAARESPEVNVKRIRKDSEKFNGKFTINNEDASIDKDSPLSTTHRKISIVSDDDNNSKLLKSPSPPKHHSSSILYITNLVRPYTLPQLKNLLQRTGKIVDNGFWIDKIKSRCYVEYETEDEAIETRHALHGVTWPVSNPKTLNVDFGSREEMDDAMTENGEKTGQPSDAWQRDQLNSDLKGNLDNKPMDRRITVREWDLGKDENKDGRFEKQLSRGNDQVDLDRKRRKSKSRSLSPVRKFKKKDEEAPSKLLDDLFKKTKTTPCIYWLPLNAETILIKEEQRRKHMAEHERRMEEIKKMAEKRSSGHQSRHSTSNRHR